MKVAIFSTHQFEVKYLKNANEALHELNFFEERLTANTAILAKDFVAVSIFTSDDASEVVLKKLAQNGTRLLVLRSAGFNHVELAVAQKMGITVVRVPEYSPYAVAEHTVALLLALNRKIIRANHRVRDLNFSLDGLIGFDLHGKTVGIIGTGKIGQALVKILHGFGCKILGYDIHPNPQLTTKYEVDYTSLTTLFQQSDIISLHVPLTPETKYLINKESISKMKEGVMLLNTSRGGLVDTKAVIEGLKTRKVGYFGIDVYEEEEGLFFEDQSEGILQDDVIARLMTFSNVLITSHQAFLTDTALRNIADITIENLTCYEQGTTCKNKVSPIA